MARLGRLAWWTLSLPSLLWLGRLGREVAYISDLSKQSSHIHFDLPIWVGIAGALGLGLAIGLINGILVVRTAVPSLIVTLGTLFAVQGLALGFSVLLTGTTSVALSPAKQLHQRLGGEEGQAPSGACSETK